MVTDGTKYVVVEMAGYVGERDVKTFPNSYSAYDYIETTYSAEERDRESPKCLHVDVRADWSVDGDDYSEYLA